MLHGYLSLGSNMGDPVSNIHHALDRLTQEISGGVDAVSPIFRTEPQGMRDQAWFANCVARIQFDFYTKPEVLLGLLAGIEAEMGRARSMRWGPRVIDIDILLLGQWTWNSSILQIPHPRMTERAFVLVPLMHLDAAVSVLGYPPAHWLSKLNYRVDGDRILQEQT